MKQHVVRALATAVGVATVLIGAHPAGAAPVAAEQVAPAHRAAADGLDPTGPVVGMVLSAMGLPSAGVSPNWCQASVGLPVSHEVLPWHGVCTPKGMLPGGECCLPLNGMM
jgi:hypothetical protein